MAADDGDVDVGDVEALGLLEVGKEFVWFIKIQKAREKTSKMS